MKQYYRQSLERKNAPYRGTTSNHDDTAFNLNVLHSLAYLEKIAGGNQNFKGHKQQIKENLNSLYHNEGEITANSDSSGKMCTIKEVYRTPLSSWTAKLNAVVTPVSNKVNTYTLTSRQHQSGYFNKIKMVAGDILSIRMTIKSNLNNNLSFAIGTLNNNNIEDISLYSVKDFYNKEITIEKKIYSSTTQEIEYGIFGTWGTEGNNSFVIKNLTISSLYEQNATVQGIDKVLKIKLRNIEETINALSDLKDTYKEVF